MVGKEVRSATLPRHIVPIFIIGILLAPAEDAQYNYNRLTWATHFDPAQLATVATFLDWASWPVAIVMIVAIGVLKGQWTWLIVAAMQGFFAGIWVALWESFGEYGENILHPQATREDPLIQDWIPVFWQQMTWYVAFGTVVTIALCGLARWICGASIKLFHRWTPALPLRFRDPKMD